MCRKMHIKSGVLVSWDFGPCIYLQLPALLCTFKNAPIVRSFNLELIGMFSTNKNHALDINLLFFCRVTYKYKNGENPIVLRITYRRERRDIMTGLSCPASNWDSGNQL